MSLKLVEGGKEDTSGMTLFQLKERIDQLLKSNPEYSTFEVRMTTETPRTGQVEQSVCDIAVSKRMMSVHLLPKNF